MLKHTLVLGLGLGLGLAIGHIGPSLVPAAFGSALSSVKQRKLDRRYAKMTRRACRSGVVQGGLALGVVVDTDDPEGLGRVKLQFPWFDDGETTTEWVRVALPPGADPSSFRPEVDDEVVVGFDLGDMRLPIVLGEVRTPPR